MPLQRFSLEGWMGGEVQHCLLSAEESKLKIRVTEVPFAAVAIMGQGLLANFMLAEKTFEGSN